MCAAAAMLAGGCAIDDCGIGTFRYYESETARAIEMRTFGLHVTTDGIDGGVTLGYSDKTLYFPWCGHACGETCSTECGQTALPDFSAGDTINPACGKFRVVPPFDRKGLGAPIAVSSRRIGLSVAANERQVGVTLGARMTTALAVEGDSDTLTMLLISSEGPLSSRMIAWGFQPCSK